MYLNMESLLLITEGAYPDQGILVLYRSNRSLVGTVLPSITTSGAAVDEVPNVYSRSLLPINFGPIFANI